MYVSLISIAIKNFKGIKEKQMNLGKVTNIYGENGTGKTTLFDAFNFLLFDKDSSDKTKFDVQPLDKHNNPIHHLETEIEAVLNVDGKEIILRKIFGEKWSKTRGKTETEFKGYETAYYINDVPQKQREYKEYIKNLVEENVFKLVTNPLYFSCLEWKKRREILMDIIGDIETENVVNYNSKLEPIRELLNDGIDNFMKATKEKIRRLKKDRESIPVRIDEANKSIQEYEFKKLETERSKIQKQIDQLDEQIADSSKAGEFLVSKRNELYNYKTELQDKQYKAKIAAEEPKRKLEKEIMESRSTLRNIENEINICTQRIAYIERDIKSKDVELQELRVEYKKIKDRTLEFNENEFICPTCNRELDPGDIEEKKAEMQNNFNKRKAKELENNMNKGKNTKKYVQEKEEDRKNELEKIKELENQLGTIEDLVNEKTKQLDNLKIGQVTTKDIETLKEKIQALEAEISEFKTEDNSQLKAKKTELQIEIKDIDKKLANKSLNEDLKARIKELNNKEKTLSSKIAELEGQEILGEEFIRTKVELLEETVNNKFRLVKFKLFNNLVNGGLEECCEPLVNGVPFSSNLNTASKINAGVDIINTLSDYYNFYAPIFIDNRESINQLIETESQIINLIVSKDKELRVEQVYIPTKDDVKELNDIVDELKNNLGDCDTHVEWPEGFELLYEEYGEKHRWWQYKYEYYMYKGQKVEFSYQEPLTEMQEGQDTCPEINIINN